MLGRPEESDGGGAMRHPASPGPGPPSGRLLTGLPLLALLGALTVACGGDRGGGAEVREAGGHDTAADRSAPTSLGTLMGDTPGGTHVMVRFAPDPPAVGPVELRLELLPPPADPELVTVDMVSPEMSAHGVVRARATPADRPGHFHARVTVPMEGLWEFYVNLDIGHDAVPFAVRVPAPEDDPAAAQSEHQGPGDPEGGHRHHVH
jgi:hypothetical protein